VIVIMNNKVLGMVRQWQRLFYKERYSVTSIARKTDFVKLAEAFGAKGFTVTEKGRLGPVLKEALSLPGPCILDCPVSEDDNVFPIIPPNGTSDAIIYCE
jgi:acetolactate synthase-1/2/3 large subunit